MIISDLAFFEDACEVSGISGGEYVAGAISSSGNFSFSYDSIAANAVTRADERCDRTATCEVAFVFQSASPFTIIYTP